MRHPRRAAPAAPMRPPLPTMSPPTHVATPAALSALLRGCASLTPRYGYTAPKHMQPPVARRNESCEARANEAPAEGGASRPDHATTTNRATAHPRAPIGSALRAASRVRFAYAALRLYRPQAHAASRSAA